MASARGGGDVWGLLIRSCLSAQGSMCVNSYLTLLLGVGWGEGGKEGASNQQSADSCFTTCQSIVSCLASTHRGCTQHAAPRDLRCVGVHTAEYSWRPARRILHRHIVFGPSYTHVAYHQCQKVICDGISYTGQYRLSSELV